MKKILSALIFVCGTFIASAWESFTVGGNLGFGSFGNNSALGGNIGLSYTSGNSPVYGGWGGGYMGSPILPYGQAYQSMLGYGNLCSQLPSYGLGYQPSYARYPVQQPLLQQLYRPSYSMGGYGYPISGYPMNGGYGFMSPCGNASPCSAGYGGYGMSPCAMSACGGGSIGGTAIGGVGMINPMSFYGNGSFGSGNLIASLGMYLQGTTVMPIAAPRCQSCCTQITPQPIFFGSARDPNLVPRH